LEYYEEYVLFLKGLAMVEKIHQYSQGLRGVQAKELAKIVIAAGLVGLGAGFGAVFFRKLIEVVTSLSFGHSGAGLQSIEPVYLLLIPVLGGLIYGPLIHFFAREAKGHGVPEVMEAMALRGGRIRPRVAAVKSLASAICIGTGGSVGREGPIVQIGSSLGSSIAQFFKMSDVHVRTLVACGAAGGIAATFNAPIAGAVFAMEIVSGQIRASSFCPVVIAAVVADVVARHFASTVPVFQVPDYLLVSSWELVFYVILGLCSAVVAAFFTSSLYYGESLVAKIRMPEYLKPVVGGLALGVLGLCTFKNNGMPQIFGVGYESVDFALRGELVLWVALALLVAKLLATIVTLGFGGSGGIFAPSLFMGAMLGEAFGIVVHSFFPEITAPPGAYALVGMAAFFSGAAHAPITAILMLFEMTGDYHIILPLMLATVMSTIVSAFINPESIYLRKLSLRGVYLPSAQDVELMQELTVAEIMKPDPVVVSEKMTVAALLGRLSHRCHQGFVVVDDDGLLSGMVSLGDLEKAEQDEFFNPDLLVAEIATMDHLLVTYSGESMGEVLQLMGQKNVSRLPVVSERGSRELVGVLLRNDIVQAYNQAILKRARGYGDRKQAERRRDGMHFAYFDIRQGSPALGKQVKDLDLPARCILVSLYRYHELHIIHGQAVLQAGDRLTVLGDDLALSALRHRL
jgi:CIC family chloride channel protein